VKDIQKRRRDEGRFGKKKCAKCGKQLTAPNYVVPRVFGQEETEKMLARAHFCTECERFYCEGCAFEAGQKMGKRRLICPRRGNDLGDASRL
jgi:uncharacterized protein with PIN domain